MLAMRQAARFGGYRTVRDLSRNFFGDALKVIRHAAAIGRGHGSFGRGAGRRQIQDRRAAGAGRFDRRTRTLRLTLAEPIAAAGARRVKVVEAAVETK